MYIKSSAVRKKLKSVFKRVLKSFLSALDLKVNRIIEPAYRRAGRQLKTPAVSRR